jgi:aspartyl-tRNA(Asn)/glutamyl-tRNA(Gln) amidotransferase subunit B
MNKYTNTKMKKIQIEKPVIGMEIHAELATNTKMFCGCSAYHFGVEANVNVCPVCLGLPGALPFPNKQALDWTILIGLALNCKISSFSKFDRKHYFYPDLPKGYQISQYDKPLCRDGYVDTKGGRVRITRVHLEEDTGKLQHARLDGDSVSLVDFNRSGVPLVEIVTEPDIRSGDQAKEFCQKLQQILRFLKVTDADMEKGSMRLEANISWGLDLGYKVEVKNLNSFRFVARSIEYELERQREIIEKGELPRQETRGWNEAKNRTVTQRYKETSADYRYFPEPDIPPFEFDGNYVYGLKQGMPLLPDSYKERFTKDFGVREDYANLLATDHFTAEYATQVFDKAKTKDADKLAGMIVNKKFDIKSIKPEEAALLAEGDKDIVTDETQIEAWVDEALTQNPGAVADYKKGKTTAAQAIVGGVMKISRGKASAKAVLDKIVEKLSS